MAEPAPVNTPNLNAAQPGPQQNVDNPPATAAVPMDTEPAPAAEPQPQPQVPQPAQLTDEQATQHLLRSIFEIGTSSLALQQNQATQAELLKTLVDRVEALTTSNSTPRGGSIKVRDPRIFSGRALELDAFIQDVDTAIKLQAPLRNGPDDAKCSYFCSWLGDGAPKQWLKAASLRDPTIMFDYPRLIALFYKRFEDPDLVPKMLHKLETLRQTGSAAAYANQFEECLDYLDWTQQMAITQFDRGLKPEVSLALVTFRQPETLSEWIPLVVDTDNKLHQLQLESKRRGTKPNKSDTPGQDRNRDRSYHPRSSNAHPQPAPPPQNNNGPVPMEIDQVTQGKRLTPEERARRKGKGLCLYCGADNHLIAKCPLIPESSRRPREAKAGPSSGKA